MNSLDLEAQDSFNYPMDPCYAGSQQELLYLGHGRALYLFFVLPPDLCSRILQKVRLFLFKVPTAASVCNWESTGQYTLYPLLHVFSCFNNIYSPPPIDSKRSVPFDLQPCCSYTEIDITGVVQDWAANSLENNGLLLVGKKDAPYAFFASHQYRILRMRPMLRFTSQDNSCIGVYNSVPCGLKMLPYPLNEK